MDTLKRAFVQGTEGRYIPLRCVGKGKTGMVWLALPSEVMNDKAEDVSTLKAKIRAVKLYVSPRSNSSEVSILKKLRERSGNVCSCFPELLEASQEDGDSEDLLMPPDMGPSMWFAMKPLNFLNMLQMMSICRSRIKCAPQIVPSVLILHIFVELSEAVGFLQAQDPPIRHSDIGITNVGLELDSQGPPGFPRVVMLDFGDSEQVASIDDRKLLLSLLVDWRQVVKLLYMLCNVGLQPQSCLPMTESGLLQEEVGDGKSEDGEWDAFVNVLTDLQFVRGNEDLRIKSLREHFVPLGMKRRNSVSREELVKIREVVNLGLLASYSISESAIKQSLR
ncbi:hypothetical protein BS50DRAFT_396417 [Corynespora cassiicola Philippines]|uniref:Protein kinase domain-containing protein n=1 Tax=Corynespora cassiicola Philippines TaxID=1448308 RepID=A0A2T2NK25_CORCC|nr:hypothetical protein BS50DRAFT_396417 [Corynespora cassiicola Philippines]